MGMFRMGPDSLLSHEHCPVLPTHPSPMIRPSYFRKPNNPNPTYTADALLDPAAAAATSKSERRNCLRTSKLVAAIPPV